MDKTFVKDAEYQVDNHNGNHQKQGEILQRSLKNLRCALKAEGDRLSQRLSGQLLDSFCGPTK